MVVCIPPSCSLLLSPSSSFFEFLKLHLRRLCSQAPGQYFILLTQPTFSLLGQRSLSSDQTLDQHLLAHTQIAPAYTLLVSAGLDHWRLRRHSHSQWFRSFLA